jgi:hypothetical protein
VVPAEGFELELGVDLVGEDLVDLVARLQLALNIRALHGRALFIGERRIGIQGQPFHEFIFTLEESRRRDDGITFVPAITETHNGHSRCR